MPEEILDLVDDNDVVIGQMPRSEVYARHLSNFRVVNAFIRNSRGQLWVPRRTATKRIFPSCLDSSMGEHVKHGESYDTAFKRGLQEELRIKIEVQYRCLGSMNPQHHGTAAFMRVYEILSDSVPNYNPDDFVEYFWLTPKEYLERVAAGEKVKEDPPRVIRHFYMQ